MKLIEIIFAPILYLIFTAFSIVSTSLYVVGNLIDAFKFVAIGDLDEAKLFLSDAQTNIVELKYLFVWKEEEENE